MGRSDKKLKRLSVAMTHHLPRAIQDGDLTALRDRIARGDDVDGRDGAGWTPPLMFACFWGRHECAQALIDAGAALDTENNIGSTALMLACEMGHLECAQALIEVQADLELTNRVGKNALMIACESPPPSWLTQSQRQGRIRCALALLGATAPIQEADFPDRAASLQFAAQRLQLIETVLASPHIIEGASPLASVRDLQRVQRLQTDAQGFLVNFASDMLANAKLLKRRRRSRRLAAKRLTVR